MMNIDCFEYDQAAEALDLINNYPSKRSDSDMENILNDFNDFRKISKGKRMIKGLQTYTLQYYTIEDKWNYKINDNVSTGKFNISLNYNEGSSKNQLEMFKDILLSAEYNLNRLQKELFPKETEASADILNNTYGGRKLEDLEELRLKAANCIKNTGKFWSKLQYIIGFGKHIYGGLEELCEYKLIKEAEEKKLVYETAKQMIDDGASFGIITGCLNADLLSVYNLAESMNRPFNLSPQEEELLKKAQKKAESKPEEQKEAMPSENCKTDEISDMLSDFSKFSRL